MVSSVRKKSAPAKWGERVVVEKRGNSYSLRGTLPSPSGGRRQRRLSLRALGLVHDKEAAAEVYARQVTRDLSVLSRREFLFKWQPKKRGIQEPLTGSLDSPATGGVYIVRSSVRATLETGDDVNPGQVLYVGQSSYFPTRVNYAHSVLYFLRETGIEFYLEYQTETRERERLFLEAKEIAAHSPLLQFGGVPEKYKGFRRGKINKNSAISPDDFGLLLSKLEGRNKKIAALIFATGKGFAEAKEATGYRHERQILTRDLARCGCNIYQLKMGAALQVLPDATVEQLPPPPNLFPHP